MANSVKLVLPTDNAIVFQTLTPQIGDINAQNFVVIPITAGLTGNSTNANCLVGSVSWFSMASNTSIPFYATLSFSRNGLPCLLDPKDSMYTVETPQVQKVVLCDVAACQKAVVETLSQFTAFGYYLNYI